MKRSAASWSLVVGILLMAVTLFAAKPAHAQFSDQSTPSLSRGWNIRLGIWVPNSQTARNVEGTIGISGILERRVYTAPNYNLLLGLGYNGFGNAYDVPVIGNIILHHDNLRYGIGAGYSFGKRLDGHGSNGPVIDLIAGYQLTNNVNPISVDLRYFFVSGSSNELDGLSVTLGYHF